VTSSTTAPVITPQAHRDELESLMSQFTNTSQHWERLLYSTGGAINLQKSFWYLLSWTWDCGVPKLDTSHYPP
jgi:hypothetical protein